VDNLSLDELDSSSLFLFHLDKLSCVEGGLLCFACAAARCWRNDDAGDKLKATVVTPKGLHQQPLSLPFPVSFKVGDFAAPMNKYVAFKRQFKVII
jgi:hypothetical protein